MQPCSTAILAVEAREIAQQTGLGLTNLAEAAIRLPESLHERDGRGSIHEGWVPFSI